MQIDAKHEDPFFRIQAEFALDLGGERTHKTVDAHGTIIGVSGRSLKNKNSLGLRGSVDETSTMQSLAIPLASDLGRGMRETSSLPNQATSQCADLAAPNCASSSSRAPDGMKIW